MLTAESCVGGVLGTLDTSIGNIGYASGTMQGEAKHLAQEGCITELQLRFAREEGCQLDLTLQSVEGAWALTGGNFAVDEKCALTDAEGSFGVYAMESADATGALVGPQVYNGSDEIACMSAAGLSLLGKATFSDGQNSIEVTFNNLSVSGEIFTATTETGTCPIEAIACVDAFCGADEYGVECGTCDIGYDCDAGQCALNTCPPQPPFGTHPFNSLTDLTVYDCDGKPVQLHELCGAPVGYFNLLAGW